MFQLFHGAGGVTETTDEAGDEPASLIA